MRGTRAKDIKKAAVALMNSMKRPLNQGYGKYHTEDNRLVEVFMRDEDGLMILGPDKKPLMTHKKGPGTIRTAYVLRSIYRNMKRDWTKTQGNSTLFNALGGV